MVIKKVGARTWRVLARTSHRNMGTYHSLGMAKRREEQVEYFKHLKKGRSKI